MKLIIAGGRDFTHQIRCNHEFKQFANTFGTITEVVSGGARGADLCGEVTAKFYGVSVTKFIPDWDGLGKRAGFVRNTEMAEYGDALLAFWDKKSKGTESMIACAKKKGLIVKVVYY